MPRPIAPDAIYQLTTLSSPSLSPDSFRLAFVRSRIDREAMETRSQVMLMTLPDGEAVPFTGSPKDTAPRFSPDGRTIAFLRSDEKERAQLWLISTDGGEAHQLTQAPGGVIEFAWAPDSKTLVFASDVDPDRVLDDYDPKKDPRVRVVRRIRFQLDTLGWRGDAHRHLFLIGVDGDKAVQLTDGDGDESSPAWSPDGNRIAFVSDRREDRDLVPYTDAYVVSAAGGEWELWSGGLVSVVAVAWSPDGSRLAAIGSQEKEIVPGWQGWLYVLEQGWAPQRLTGDSVNPVGGFLPLTLPPELRWTPRDEVLFLGDQHGQSYLWSAPVSGGEPTRVVGGNALFSAVSFDAEAKRAVVLGTSPASAGHLELVELGDGTQRLLVQDNLEYLQEHPPARQEKFRFSRAGYEIECRLYLPPDHDPSRRYPLVVDIHGGPHGVFSDAFSMTQQVLATAGYMVLCVNPSGSSTYGADFAKAVIQDWGGEDYLDILEAVEMVSGRADVDVARLGVHGYSYGGYMSGWIVGHDDRFGAAVIGAPCTDLVALYGTSDIGVSFGEVQWGGQPSDAEQVWRERSPISYADQVRTPVLLLHGEADHRVPIEQSEAYFVALKRRGKEVELVRFPGCAHSMLRTGHPRMREEYWTRMLAWFDQHLGR